MDGANGEEFAVGCILAIKTTLGDEFEGQIITYDRPSNIVVLHILLLPHRFLSISLLLLHSLFSLVPSLAFFDLGEHKRAPRSPGLGGTFGS